MTKSAANGNRTGSVEDRRAAVGHYVTLGTTLISTAMAAAAFEAAVALFLLKDHETTFSFYLLGACSVLAIVASVMLGGIGINASSESGWQGDWRLTAGGAWFNLQAIALIAGFLLFIAACLLGVEFRPQQESVRTGTPGTDVQALLIGEIGPFPTGSHEATSAIAKQSANVAGEIQARGADLRLLIFTGAADKRALTPELARIYGSNEGLARARTESVAEMVAPGAQVPVVFTNPGPAAIGAAVPDKDLARDRIVKVYALIRTQEAGERDVTISRVDSRGGER